MLFLAFVGELIVSGFSLFLLVSAKLPGEYSVSGDITGNWNKGSPQPLYSIPELLRAKLKGDIFLNFEFFAVLVNKDLLTWSVPVNKKLLTKTINVNKILLTLTVLVNNFSHIFYLGQMQATI